MYAGREAAFDIVFRSSRVPSPEQAESLMEAAKKAGDYDLLERLTRQVE